MNIKEVPVSDVSLELLLIADPSPQSIENYLHDSWCFAAVRNSAIIGVAVFQPIDSETAELFNISIYPEFQKLGIGTRLIQQCFILVKERGIERIVLGTGAFGYQLTFYQRNGFRVDSVVKNHFINTYSEPIIENGIRHIDMLRLSIEL